MQPCRRIAPSLSFLVLLLAGCSSDRRHAIEVTNPAVTTPPRTASPGQEDEVVAPVLQEMNNQLVARGLGRVHVLRAELVGGFTSEHKGITIIDNDRDKQAPAQFVPGDVRRSADGTKITYLVDLSDSSPNGGLTSAQTEAAIDRAMATWNAVDCVNIPIVKRADSGADPDLADGLLGFGTVGTPFSADIVHAGWMPPAFFDRIFPGATNILAVTFTFALFDDASGNDINNDRKLDVGWREIYYNNLFAWGINADPPVADVETVALHEAGHGLSQNHFGLIFENHNGDLQFAPFSLMNATIFGQNHVLQGSDVGGHCSIWGNWPNR